MAEDNNSNTPQIQEEPKQEKTSFSFIFLDKWAPALITALIGGSFIAFLVPSIQSNYAEETALKKHKVELWESIGNDFTQLIEWNFRLVSIQKTINEKEEIHNEKEEEYNKELQIMLKRKEEYRQNRDNFLTKLNGEIVIASFYFDDSIKSLACEYRKWISDMSNWTIDTMPSRSKFEEWRDKFVSKIGANLKF